MSENFNKEGQISNEAQKQLPGAFQPSDEFYRVVSKKAPVLPLDEKFIQANARVSTRRFFWGSIKCNY
jgi:hypothetical protein